jgi:hypothetical protein
MKQLATVLFVNISHNTHYRLLTIMALSQKIQITIKIFPLELILKNTTTRVRMCGISIAKIQVNKQQQIHKCNTHSNAIFKKDMPKG